MGKDHLSLQLALSLSVCVWERELWRGFCKMPE